MFDKTYEVTRLALDVGEQVRGAREATGLSQKELAARMGTSAAALASLEAGDVGATLTTLQKVATALDLRITSSSCQLQSVGASPTLDKCRRVAGE